MNKLKIVVFILAVTPLLLLLGCDDILERVEPSTSVSGEIALTSEEGVNAIRASMYSKIRAAFGFTTEYFVAPAAMADETRNRPGSTRYQGLNQARSDDGDRDHLGSWSDVYNIIQEANLIAGAIEDGVLDPEVQSRYRGEALAIRAFAMHQGAKAFGYEPGREIGGWDQSIIIRTEPTLTLEDADRRPRSTNREVYDQIITDLNEAKTLLAGINANNTFVTEAFVDGLLARVHLYDENWSEAANSAQDAINNSGRELQNTEGGVAGMFNENQGNHPEALFKIVVDPNTENTTGNNTFVNNGPAGYTSDQWVAQIPTQFLLDKYEEDDLRWGWYGDCRENQRLVGNEATQCDVINEPGFSILKFNGVKGNAVDDLPYMRVAEMYLIWAEAAAKAANDPSSGAEPLNTLREARGLEPLVLNDPVLPNDPAFSNMQAFEDEILDERMRELAVEGHRFFDLKRLGRAIRNPDGSTKIRADAFRMLAPIPDARIAENELIEQNPGY